VDVNNNGNGSNGVIQFTGAAAPSGNTTLNITGGNGYSLSLTGMLSNAGVGTGTTVLNPTTANLSLGTFSSTSAGLKTLQLDGSSAGNAVTGNITDGTLGTVGLVKANTSTWTLSGSNTYSLGTTAAGGTLVLASAGALPSNSGLNISSGATVSIANHSTNATYVPVLSTFSNSGILDMGNNAMLIHNSNTLVGIINGQAASGYNQGSWNGSGSGVINSSLAAIDSRHNTAVGVATGLTTTWQGMSVVATDVLVKDTYYGDADLSGGVDGTDYSRIDNGYLNNLTGWYNGDFNYDGVINGSDYTLIDNTFNTQGAQLSEQIASATAQVQSAPVPEPAGIAFFLLAAVIGRPSNSRIACLRRRPGRAV
jgi:hypothetical protein